ncbi:MAG TPA: PEP-CTERM sorting domain-containing protein [Verrucomicrobiae bacterium]|nr:PEP-CTERM sorting domain-containing protein [Verrucomicrobiae bacterium]
MKTFGPHFKHVILAAVLLACPFVSQVKAVLLSPGGVLAATYEPDPSGGTALDTMSVPFSSGVLQGTLISSVIAGDANNPFGGLTFTYQIVISSLSTDSASQISVSSYASFLTDTSYNNTGTYAGTDVPDYMSRSSGVGDVVRFTFLFNTIGAGSSSALLVIQSSAQNWNFTTAGVTDGQTVNVNSLAPSTVPEPASCALILVGLGLAGFRLRRSK